MRKLFSNFRIGELHAVLAHVEDISKKFTFTEQDILNVIAALCAFVKRLCAAIKRDEVPSVLNEKDRLRDVAFRAFYYLLLSYKNYPKKKDADIHEAGVHCYAVVAKYRSTTRENYYIGTSNVDSLLNDFTDPTHSAMLAKIPGAQAFLDALTDCQSEFRKAKVKYVEYRCDKGESASSLRKPIVRFMNDTFLPMASLKNQLDPDTYGEFMSQVQDVVNQANIMAKKRLLEGTPEEDENPTGDDNESGGNTQTGGSSDAGDNTGSGQGGNTDSGSGTGSGTGGNTGSDDDSMPAA